MFDLKKSESYAEITELQNIIQMVQVASNLSLHVISFTCHLPFFADPPKNSGQHTCDSDSAPKKREVCCSTKCLCGAMRLLSSSTEASMNDQVSDKAFYSQQTVQDHSGSRQNLVSGIETERS
nr:unnamed protein product [Callosobruchus analis]